MKKRGRNAQQSTSNAGDISRSINHHRKRTETNGGSYRAVVLIALGLLACVGLVLWGQHKDGDAQQPSESTPHPIDRSVPDIFTDTDYELALKKKLASSIQPGWFKSTSAAVVKVEPVTSVQNVTTFIKELSSFSWPTISNIRNLHNALPIFNWDLTQFALDSTNEKEENEQFVLPGCRLQLEPVFVLGSERDKGGMVGSKHDQPVMYVNVTMKDFLRGTFREKLYLYWTGELDYLESHFGLRSTTTTDNENDNDTTTRSIWESFHVEEPNLQIVDDEANEENDTEGTSKEDRRVRPMVWLSHPGVVAQTHYDTQHNIFLQVQGFKRFHLFPPATELYVYPNIHQSFRQSQIHFEQPRATTTNDDTHDDVFDAVTDDTVEAIELTLGPGDILYIPPFWQHRVESLTLSLSLSILSPSEVEAAIAELFWLQVPFGGDLQQHRSMRIRAVIAYMESIFRLLQSDFSGEATEVVDHTAAETTIGELLRHRFAQSLYRSRFAPLLRTVNVAVNHSSSSNNNTPNLCPLRREDTPKDGDHADAEQRTAQLDAEEQVLSDARGNFEEAARHFVDTLQQLQTDDGIKRTFLRDYLEHLVRWAVGPQLTGEVLHRCF